MRLSVIGLPGSGKSTVAKRISQKLGIPHIHIDRFWFEAGGRLDASEGEKERVREHIRGRVKTAIQAESWVSDGVYSRVQPLIAERADKIIFLDIPLPQLLWNHLVRMVNRKGRHPELSLWNDLTFFKEIIYRRTKKGSLNKIKDIVEANRDKTITLHTRKEITDYISALS